MDAVQFETGKATLISTSFDNLDGIVEIMRQYPDYKLSISGHTDNVGDDEKNLKLSTDRAKTCYDYLIFRGVRSERLRYAGFGEARPVADNSTPAGREKNRRVEFELTLD
ncbi:MAG: OmpA family protein [Lewinellaceae bacterium]|nr:OmpA family protein [Lewinellaceae bacterium]